MYNMALMDDVVVMSTCSVRSYNICLCGIDSSKQGIYHGDDMFVALTALTVDFIEVLLLLCNIMYSIN